MRLDRERSPLAAASGRRPGSLGASTRVLQTAERPPVMNTPTTQPSQKPAAVSTAIKLLYTTLVIGALRSALEWSHLTRVASPGFVLFVMLFTFALLVWLIDKVNRGRNWARITCLVFFILGVPMSILHLLQSP